jgi:hypothetical protein
MRTGSRIVAPLVFAGMLAPSARAIDGVREISFRCATGTGCFPGDTPGFPVTITESGSYRLTSLLQAPDQDTTVISITATNANVTLDLNGFVIRGTGSYPGPPSTACTGAGAGEGVRGTGSGVVVSNGYVIGMGSAGLRLGPNARVERLIVSNCCGVGIAVGAASLVHETMVTRNRGTGIVASDETRVSACIAFLNGGDGITSTSNFRFSVDGCIAANNGVDGIFGGTGSLVTGNLTFGNLDDGIALFGSSEVVENTAIANTGRGITVLGSPATFNSTAVGLNVANDNTGLQLSGGALVGCNVLDSVVSCPP